LAAGTTATTAIAVGAIGFGRTERSWPKWEKQLSWPNVRLQMAAVALAIVVVVCVCVAVCYGRCTNLWPSETFVKESFLDWHRCDKRIYTTRTEEEEDGVGRRSGWDSRK